MTWSYTNPGASTNDAVRWHAGDTDTTDQLVTNEEIAYALTLEGSVLNAAAAVCEAIAAKFSRQVDKDIASELRNSYSQRSKAYSERAKELRSRAARTAAPFIAGISVAAKDVVSADTDRVPSPFAVGMHDNLSSD